jgi:predicted RecA/RadA family phage recombinase
MTVLNRKAYLLQNADENTQLTFTNNTAADIAVGDVVGVHSDAGKRIAAIALTNIATGETGQVLIKGRARISKAAVVLLQGHSAWWDGSASVANIPANCKKAEDFCIGMVVADTVAGDSRVDVDLNAGPDANDLGSSSSSASA